MYIGRIQNQNGYPVMHPQAPYHVEGPPPHFVPPGSHNITGYESAPMNQPSYHYGPNFTIPIPPPQPTYDSTARDLRPEDTPAIFEGTNSLPGGLPPSLQISPPAYIGSSLVTNNSSSFCRNGPSSLGSPEQLGRIAITEDDNNIYAAFLQFRNHLQKYVHAYQDSNSPLHMFWRAVHSVIEVRSLKCHSHQSLTCV